MLFRRNGFFALFAAFQGWPESRPSFADRFPGWVLCSSEGREASKHAEHTIAANTITSEPKLMPAPDRSQKGTKVARVSKNGAQSGRGHAAQPGFGFSLETRLFSPLLFV